MRDKQSQTEKKKLKIKEKKTERIHYFLLIFALIICIINSVFIESKTIGGDYRYKIYIILDNNIPCVPSRNSFR